MQRRFISFLVFLFVSFNVAAQKGDLVVKSGDKGLYLVHKVAAKESFYSIGRLYNVHPKSLASYNKLDMNKGIQIDQQLRVPLTDTNFTQQGNTGTPVYYKTGEQEGLMKVSNANRNVTLANLRRWNNLSSDAVSPGTKLIIGFLKSNEMKAITIKNPEPKKEEPKTEPEVTTPPEEKKEEKPAEKKEEKPVEKKEEPKAVKEEKPAVTTNYGYFKTAFDQQIRISPATKNETVTSGIFKTASGWDDAKYYLLIDGVAPGTIVKVTNPTNDKAIFAKVLGEMSGIRQNEGLNIRISNAAASVLEVAEQDKFIVKVNY